MSERKSVLERLLGVKLAEKVDDTVAELDSALEQADIEHKMLDEAQAGELADMVIELVSDSARAPEDKRAALVQMLIEVSTSDETPTENETPAPETAAEAGMDKPEEMKAAKPEADASLILKMIDDMAKLVDAQNALTEELVDTRAKLAGMPDALKALESEVKTLRMLAAARPRIASKAAATLATDAEADALKAMDEQFEIHPVLGVKVRK